jgi:hypothetical protein
MRARGAIHLFIFCAEGRQEPALQLCFGQGQCCIPLPGLIQEDDTFANVEHFDVELFDVFGKIRFVGCQRQLPLAEPLVDLCLQPEELRLRLMVHSSEKP